jgi:hypothetical protein
VHADGWIRTAKLAFFMALGFVRFDGESTSLQPPVTQTVGQRAKRKSIDTTLKVNHPGG